MIYIIRDCKEGRDVRTYLLYCSRKGSLFLTWIFVLLTALPPPPPPPHSVEASKLVDLSELISGLYGFNEPQP